VHGQGVRAALRQHRAARADLLRLGLPTGSGRAALPLGMEEHRAVHPTARATYLPIPDIGNRKREPAGVCHVHHFTCRAPRARLSLKVRDPRVTAPKVVHKSPGCPTHRVGLPALSGRRTMRRAPPRSGHRVRADAPTTARSPTRPDRRPQHRAPDRRAPTPRGRSRTPGRGRPLHPAHLGPPLRHRPHRPHPRPAPPLLPRRPRPPRTHAPRPDPGRHPRRRRRSRAHRPAARLQLRRRTTATGHNRMPPRYRNPHRRPPHRCRTRAAATRRLGRQRPTPGPHRRNCTAPTRRRMARPRPGACGVPEVGRAHDLRRSKIQPQGDDRRPCRSVSST
jgi:hypothetical protein